MISHHHNTLFVHIPKCGGQSIEYAFLNDLGLSWENRGPLLLRPRMKGELAPPRLAHLRSRDYVGNFYLSQDLFDKYYKFSIVRCPYQRVVSFYNYLNLAKKIKTLEEFVFDYLPVFLQLDHERYWFFRPQIDYLKNSRGGWEVDAVYQLEKIQESWSDIALKAGICNASLPHVNKSPTCEVNNLASLSVAGLEAIRELYSEDFAEFPQYDKRIRNPD